MAVGADGAVGVLVELVLRYDGRVDGLRVGGDALQKDGAITPCKGLRKTRRSHGQQLSQQVSQGQLGASNYFYPHGSCA